MKHIESLASYLHEDWADDYPTSWDAIDDFATGEPLHASLLRHEVELAIDKFPADTALAQRLFDLGLRYCPSADGWPTYREWLLAVADRVDELLRGQPPEPPDRPRSGSAQV